jgi:peptidoglycan/xylan/chitin deacetylase (PgdA/CDA1 family)
MRGRSKRGSAAAGLGVLAMLLTLVVATPPVSASTPTVVTIQFDDGTVDQFDNGFPILEAHGMVATFFVNTGPILAGDPGHMTTADLHTLFNAGNEIAGHTVDHANIQPLTVAEAEHQVCDDRNTLLDASQGFGFPAESFAYPFGSFDATSEAIVHYCGYNSARTVSGISKSRAAGETVPPADAYATRTPPNPKKATKVSTIEGYVLRAEADKQSTDWVQLVFHKVCDKGTGGHCGAYAIRRSKLTALLVWLQGEIDAGRVVVETTAQVIGGAVNPACHWDTDGTGCVPPTP